jgi:hypothetical protein
MVEALRQHRRCQRDNGLSRWFKEMRSSDGRVSFVDNTEETCSNNERRATSARDARRSALEHLAPELKVFVDCNQHGVR